MTTIRSPVRQNKQIVVVTPENIVRRSQITTQLAHNEVNTPKSIHQSSGQFSHALQLLKIQEGDETQTAKITAEYHSQAMLSFISPATLNQYRVNESQESMRLSSADPICDHPAYDILHPTIVSFQNYTLPLQRETAEKQMIISKKDFSKFKNNVKAGKQSDFVEKNPFKPPYVSNYSLNDTIEEGTSKQSGGTVKINTIFQSKCPRNFVVQKKTVEEHLRSTSEPSNNEDFISQAILQVDSAPKMVSTQRLWKQVKGQSVENGQQFMFADPKIHTRGFKTTKASKLQPKRIQKQIASLEKTSRLHGVDVDQISYQDILKILNNSNFPTFQNQKPSQDNTNSFVYDSKEKYKPQTPKSVLSAGSPQQSSRPTKTQSKPGTAATASRKKQANLQNQTTREEPVDSHSQNGDIYHILTLETNEDLLSHAINSQETERDSTALKIRARLGSKKRSQQHVTLVKELRQRSNKRNSQETQKIVQDDVSTKMEQSGNIETFVQINTKNKSNNIKTVIAARNIQTAPEQKVVFISPESGATSTNFLLKTPKFNPSHQVADLKFSSKQKNDIPFDYDPSFKNMTEPQIACRMIKSLTKDYRPLKQKRVTIYEYEAKEGTKILFDEGIYLDQTHENQRLMELEMFYRQRREINQNNYLTFVAKRIAEGVDPARVKVQPKLKALVDLEPSMRNKTHFSSHLVTFDKSSGIKSTDFSKNSRLNEMRSRITAVESLVEVSAKKGSVVRWEDTKSKLGATNYRQRRNESYLGYLSFNEGQHVPPTLMQKLPTESKKDLSGYKHRFTIDHKAKSDLPNYAQLGLEEPKAFKPKNSIHYHDENQPTEENVGHNGYIKGCGQYWNRAGKGVPQLRIQPKRDFQFTPTVYDPVLHQSHHIYLKSQDTPCGDK